MRAGQVSIEFFAIFFVLITLMSFSMLVYFEKDTTVSQYLILANAKLEANELAEAINNVHQAGNGTSISLLIPERLGTGVRYNISVTGNRVQFSWEGGMHQAPVLTSKINTTSIDTGTTVSITNNNTWIVIENVE